MCMLWCIPLQKGLHTIVKKKKVIQFQASVMMFFPLVLFLTSIILLPEVIQEDDAALISGPDMWDIMEAAGQSYCQRKEPLWWPDLLGVRKCFRSVSSLIWITENLNSCGGKEEPYRCDFNEQWCVVWCGLTDNFVHQNTIPVILVMIKNGNARGQSLNGIRSHCNPFQSESVGLGTTHNPVCSSCSVCTIIRHSYTCTEETTEE